MKNYNVKYYDDASKQNGIKEKLIVKAKNENEAMYRIYAEMPGIFITAIEERKL